MAAPGAAGAGCVPRVTPSRSSATSPALCGALASLLPERSKDLLLPAAAAAAARGVVVLCSRGRDTKDMAGARGALSLSVPEGAKTGWAILPASKLRVWSPTCTKNKIGADKIVLGFLPAASRDNMNQVARSATNTPPGTFEEEFGLLLDAIPLHMNSAALFGEHEILEDITKTATRTFKIVATLTPVLVNIVSDRKMAQFFPKVTVFTDTEQLGMNLVESIKSSALEIATALETVRSETKEGYVREQSLVSAIVNIREPARFIAARVEMLPPPYAGVVPLSAEEDKLSYYKGLAAEFSQLCGVLEMALNKGPNA